MGRLVLDRFRIAEELGRGGFATVYRAWDERLERAVAVKALAPAADARRVLREGQASARLNHPGIVTLYELGEDAHGAYLVSELVEGASLRDHLREGTISDRDVGEIGIQLAAALEHAHGRGVVHRDLKPENVVAEVDPGRGGHPGRWRTRAMLTDFGIARLSGGASLTHSGEVVGTLAYMAPEQAEGRPAGPAADLYSLGLVLYECWSGANPIAAATPAATARAIGRPVRSLGDERPDLPAELVETVDRCLSPAPDERPAPAAVAEALRRALPSLDGAHPVPLAGETGERGGGAWALLARVAALASVAAALSWLAWGAGHPGAALVLALLFAPIPLLVDQVRFWIVAPLAPLLGLAGLAPVVPAIAGLAGAPRSCAALAASAWSWLAAAESVLDKRLLFGTLDPASPQWEESPGAAVDQVLLPLLSPGSLAAGASWALAAGLLAAVLQANNGALRAIGALVWGAGLVAVHRLLAGAGADPATAAVVAGLIAVLAAALWLRATPWRRGVELRRADSSQTISARSAMRGTA